MKVSPLVLRIGPAAVAFALAAALGAVALRTASAQDDSAGKAAPAAPPAATAAASQPATRVVAATGPTTRRVATSRRVSRPELTAAEYEAVAKDLREKYAKPPAEWPKATIDPGVEFVELGPVPEPQHPANNPFTKEKAELGQTLFFDPRLSGSGQIACASCHEAELGWSDGRAVSFGHARTPLPRNSPSLTNVWARKSMFWDGRAKTLEEQALEPLFSAKEMNATAEDAVVKVLSGQPGYAAMFKKAFGEEAVTIDRVAQALATFQRTIVSRNSSFERFVRGNPQALSDAAVRGLHLFRTDARCANCHHGPLMTDEQFHNLGLTYYGRKLQDLGRYNVTKKAEDVGKFRTPSLRNVTRSAPFMHVGLFDLPGLLRAYNAGMFNVRPRPGQENDPLFPVKSPLLKPLGLNRHDLADLLAFLESLEEIRLRVRAPEIPGLHPGPGGPDVAPEAGQ